MSMFVALRGAVARPIPSVQTCSRPVLCWAARWKGSAAPAEKKDEKKNTADQAATAKPAAAPADNATPASESSKPLPVTFEDVSKAMHRIRNGIVRSDVKKSHFLSKLCGMEVYLKQEFSQFTGSFKERGARNAVMCLNEEERERGVIAASAGNHALALAWHGTQLGVPVTVVMPTIAPLTKVNKCKSFGVNVVQHGEHILQAKDHAVTAPEFKGMRYVNGYDDVEIIAGAGTMGMEILEQVPDVDYIVVPVGGAGLIAGISLATKTLQPEVKVIGVEPYFCASLTEALAAGKPVHAKTTPTLADGLAVPTVGDQAFEVAKRHVDGVELVSEKFIALAVLRLLEMEKFVVEGGGATGLAGILPGGPLDIPELKGKEHDLYSYRRKKVVVPLCGGNIDVPVLGRVIDRGLAADTRLVRFVTTVSDRPGGISGLAASISDAGGSIRDIYHERAWLHSNMDQVQIKCVVEVAGVEHREALHEELIKKGYEMNWGEDGKEGLKASETW
ncbi:unnamed protein product [Ascophyllum nodosum]